MKVITKASQMTKPLSWTPVDAELLKEEKEWWYKDKPDINNPRDREQMEKIFLLRDRLLSFGGDLACMDLYEPDYKDIMERGQFWYGDHARMKKGLPSQCHLNSARLWDANQGRCQIATGYALSDDGRWVQHSWVVQPLATKYRIWETTIKRIAYFGFIMTDEECENFFYDHY